MSEEDSGAEKEHEASQKKLDDARAKGEIPRSTDLSVAAGYSGLLLAAYAFGPAAMMRIGETSSVLLGQSDRLSTLMLGRGAADIAGILEGYGTAIAPFFLLPALAALLTILAQRAMIFSPSKLVPKLSRISPLSGIKNKFGRKGLFEFAKSFVKLVVISGLLFAFLLQNLGDLMGMIYLDPAIVIARLMRLIIKFLTLILLIAAGIGALDFFWQRAEHLRSNRMSRKEMLDEHKNAEGDPHMKAKRRQKGQDIATNRMLADVATANVVIVNPTHFAVALKWDRNGRQAPICVAKGVDEIAARIRERAAEAGVPLHSDPPTARLLHATLDIGAEVEPDQYRAVAAAIRFAESIREKARNRGSWSK